MKEFSELTLQKLNQNGNYYVYGLVDPRNNKLFYIGKGTENRVFQHVADSNKNPNSEKEKLQIIRNIEDSGKRVIHILINWGLNETEAFASEASLINLMNYISEIPLSNIVAGHHSKGCLSVEDIERAYGAELLSVKEIQHKILVIKVNKLYNRNMTNREIYDVVRGVWRVNIHRVEEVEYVLGVYANLIVACYKPDRWFKVSERVKDKLPNHIKEQDLKNIQNRVFFECDDIDTFDENQLFYLNKSIEKWDYVQKSQNPIIYIGM